LLDYFLVLAVVFAQVGIVRWTQVQLIVNYNIVSINSYTY